MVPWPHASLHPTLHIDWFSRFLLQLTGETYFTMGWAMSPPPKNCPFPRGIRTKYMVPWTHQSLHPCRMSIGSAVFLQLTGSLTLQWGGPCPVPPKTAPTPEGSGPNTWFLGPTRVHNPNDISIGSSVSAGLTVVSNRQTDTDTAQHQQQEAAFLHYMHAMHPNNYNTHTHNCLTAFDLGLPG